MCSYGDNYCLLLMQTIAIAKIQLRGYSAIVCYGVYVQTYIHLYLHMCIYTYEQEQIVLFIIN